MKKITAAVVIINSKGDILGCHGTNRTGGGFDFPKGCLEDGESPRDAAIRELQEETGIVLDGNFLIDCGEHPHNREKRIHIFLYKTEEFPDPDILWCSTYFELNGKMLPEVNGYEIIPKEKRQEKFNKVLLNKFEMIDKANEADIEND